MDWRISVGDDSTSATVDRSEGGDGSTVFVCAHGAGGSMNDRGTLAVAKALGPRGLDIVRFNFLYKEKHSGRPDPMPKLKETTQAVVARVRAEIAFVHRTCSQPSRNACRRPSGRISAD